MWAKAPGNKDGIGVGNYWAILIVYIRLTHGIAGTMLSASSSYIRHEKLEVTELVCERYIRGYGKKN